jgi:hypothetical protein
MQTLSLTFFMISQHEALTSSLIWPALLAQGHLWGAFLEVSVILRCAVEKDR